jgi:hypothetical protein
LRSLEGEHLEEQGMGGTNIEANLVNGEHVK